jgi:hypothetical protein
VAGQERAVEEEAGDDEEDGDADRQAVGEGPPPAGSLGAGELAGVEGQDGDRGERADSVEGREARVTGGRLERRRGLVDRVLPAQEV